MLVNNVQESTVTTGTGDITLDGSSENGRTLTSQFSLNERFSYVIDDGAGNWENGVGYLSSTSILVRELPLDGSAALPVNFAAGSKEVFNAITSEVSNPANTNKPTVISTSYLCSTHAASTGGSVTLTAGRLYYTPFVLEYSAGINSIGVRLNAGAVGACQVALYSVGSDGMPANVLAKGTIDTATGGATLTSISKTIRAGTYWAAILSSVAVSARYIYNIYSKPLGMTGFNYELRPNGYLYIDSQDGTVQLPDTAIVPTTAAAASGPSFIAGVA